MGDDDGQDHIKKTLSEKMSSDATESFDRMLNRIIHDAQRTGAVASEADPQHGEMIIRQLGLEGAKDMITPAEKKKAPDA